MTSETAGPRTPAGKALLSIIERGSTPAQGAWGRGIEVVEEEAVTLALTELRREVEGLDVGYADTDGSKQPGLVERRGVLALIDKAVPR